MEYASEKRIESKALPGVCFTIARMSFGRRIELTQQIWELAGKAEHLVAGGDVRVKRVAALVAAEIDRIYLRWGLRQIEGLTVDGAQATAELVVMQGPEALCREVVAAIKAECGLTVEEAKN
jgi:hypothetical protein